MNDMQILSEIRQIEVSMPRLKQEAKEASRALRAARAPLKPVQDRFKTTKAAVTAAKARMAELLTMGGE